MKKQPISFEAQKRGNNIEITANYPDSESKTVLVYGEDIKVIHGLNAAQFMQQMGEDEAELAYMFDLVNSLQIAS